MQAAGYTTNFSPAKLVQAGASGGAAWTGGMQDALLTGERRKGCLSCRTCDRTSLLVCLLLTALAAARPM